MMSYINENLFVIPTPRISDDDAPLLPSQKNINNQRPTAQDKIRNTLP